MSGEFCHLAPEIFDLPWGNRNKLAADYAMVLKSLTLSFLGKRARSFLPEAQITCLVVYLQKCVSSTSDRFVLKVTQWCFSTTYTFTDQSCMRRKAISIHSFQICWLLTCCMLDVLLRNWEIAMNNSNNKKGCMPLWGLHFQQYIICIFIIIFICIYT